MFHCWGWLWWNQNVLIVDTLNKTIQVCGIAHC
jgi:hypothetical protein